TESILNAVVGEPPGLINVAAHPLVPVAIPPRSSCGALNFATTNGPAQVIAPSNSDAGRDALRDSVAGTYPDPATDATKRCINIARSDAPPRAIGPSGDNATFEYYGYALDTVTWASTSLNAPAALTQTQLQGIYHCTSTDWSQVGGASGPIQRVLPPDG